jgi:hypothetical protein
MPNYIITTHGGTECLVTARTVAAAERKWDSESESGFVEPRGQIRTRPASKRDVRYCAEKGHDYRVG